MPVPKPKIVCVEEGCNNSFADHSWGATAAYKAGWFVMRDGTAYCFDHNPPWVAEWRAKQREKKQGKSDTEIAKQSTVSDVLKALEAAVEKNPRFGLVHATYDVNPDKSITIRIEKPIARDN